MVHPKQVRILHRTPRNIKEIRHRVNLKKGLRIYFYFAYAMFIFAILLVAVAVFYPGQPFEVRVYQGLFGPLLFGGFGLSFYGPAKKRLRQRINCFTYGNFVMARVVRHGRVFVPYKSFRDYSIETEYTTPEDKKIVGIIQRPNDTLQKQLPIGTEIQALYDPGSNSLFLPIEIGVEIVEY